MRLDVTWLCVFLAIAVGARGENAPMINAEGNARLIEGAFDAALERYDAAKELAPDEPVLHLNSGLALARQGKDEEAIGEFSKVLASGDPSLYARARYNTGLILARKAEALVEEESTSPGSSQNPMLSAVNREAPVEGMKEMEALALYESAMEANREAMRAWRDDSDPRVNYAICKRRYEEIKQRLEEQQQEQNSQPKDEEQDEDKDQPEGKQQESGEGKQDGDEQEQNDQQQQEEKQDENGEEKQQDEGEQEEDEQQAGDEQKQEEGKQSEDEKKSSGSEGEENEGEQSEAQAQPEDGMSEEDARQVLNMLEGNDKEALGRLLRMRLGRVPNMENDW